LEADHVIAMESAGDLLVESGVREQVAGELFDGEPIERHILLERVDNPLAPAGHVSSAVDVVAVGIGVAGGVEPVESHALTVSRRGKQRVDESLVRVRPIVGEEAVDRVESGWKPCQVERHASKERRLVGLGGGNETFGLESREDESIDWVAGPV